MKMLMAAALLVASGAVAVGQGVALDLSLPVPGEALPPGEPITVEFDWRKDANEPERRLVFRVRMHDANTGELLGEALLNNSGEGILGEAGSLQAVFPAPNASLVYFEAYAAPWSLNRWIIEKYESYPTDGTYTYEWTAGHYGVTQDLYYLGRRIAVSSGRNVTYCSGVAFEAFLLAYLEYNELYGHTDIGGMNWNDMETFRRLWYGTRADLDPELKLAALAIPTYDLGLEIVDLEEAQKGDFVQFWAHAGWGHNPVFESWIRDNDGEIIGIRYWGSQGSSNGIGYSSGSINSRSIDIDRVYLGRVRKPRDQGDIDFALGSASTESAPTQIGQPFTPYSGFALY